MAYGLKDERVFLKNSGGGEACNWKLFPVPDDPVMKRFCACRTNSREANRYIQTVDCRTFIADTGIKNKKSQS